VQNKAGSNANWRASHEARRITDLVGHDQDVAIVYYHQGHEYNVDNMVKRSKIRWAISRGISAHQHAGPNHRVPRYNRLPNRFQYDSLPEAIGFVARVDPNDLDDIDYPYYVTGARSSAIMGPSGYRRQRARRHDAVGNDLNTRHGWLERKVGLIRCDASCVTS
jgi:hypothetical protein